MSESTGKTLIEYVIQRLEEDEDIVVPIMKLWNEWVSTHGGPTLVILDSLLFQ